jgi:hypothetical protein
MVYVTVQSLLPQRCFVETGRSRQLVGARDRKYVWPCFELEGMQLQRSTPCQSVDIVRILRGTRPLGRTIRFALKIS